MAILRLTVYFALASAGLALPEAFKEGSHVYPSSHQSLGIDDGHFYLGANHRSHYRDYYYYHSGYPSLGGYRYPSYARQYQGGGYYLNAGYYRRNFEEKLRRAKAKLTEVLRTKSHESPIAP